jgi:hypothetical protein
MSSHGIADLALCPSLPARVALRLASSSPSGRLAVRFG